jgi:hypothetical protein
MLIISARSTFDENAEYHGGWSPTWSAYGTDGLLTSDAISDRIKVTRSQIGIHSFECGTDSCGGTDEPPMTLVTTIQHLLVPSISFSSSAFWSLSFTSYCSWEEVISR